mmetsp:Transcript_9223/g.30432  ORF Transcript_9223/g.30432 Transcript_9223/m.30432 type:complete len:376 (-) Transcript_9223:131-1258(-)
MGPPYQPLGALGNGAGAPGDEEPSPSQASSWRSPAEDGAEEEEAQSSAAAPLTQPSTSAADVASSPEGAGLITQVTGPDTRKVEYAPVRTEESPSPSPSPGLGLPQSPRRAGEGKTARDGHGAASSSSWFSTLMCCFSAPSVEESSDKRLQMNAPGSPGGGLGGGVALAKLALDPNHAATGLIPPHSGAPFIPPLHARDSGKKTLVLDLDETLVHSSFKPVPNPDYVIPVDIDGKVTDVYVVKRPWVDHFLAEVSDSFEVGVFTASLAKYADPLLDLLDKSSIVRWRLFRESCYPFGGNYVKDLTCLGRELKDTIIVDNSPHSYIFQPLNAIPIRSFIDDVSDNDLLELLPFLKGIQDVDDVTSVLSQTKFTADG